MIFLLLCLVCCIHSSQCGYIPRCTSDGILLVQENRSLIIRCFSHFRGVDDETLTWEIRPWRDQPSLEIVCIRNSTHDRGCSSHPDVEVSFRGYRRSYLTISRVERAMFNSSTISCNPTSRYPDRHQESPCLIDVVYNSDVRSCDAEIHKPSWTLNGACDVTQVYSSLGNYGYKIYQNYNKTGGTLITTGTVYDTSSLTSFTNTSSGNVYYRGRLPFSFSIPSDLGNVTFSVLVTPGILRKDINKTVIIGPPSNPELANCNQHTFIEGGNFPATPCECRVTFHGSPSGRLQWVADDVVQVSGEYGVTQLVFPYDKLTATHNGMDMRCQVDWVVRKNTTSFTQHIFYGPDRADIVLLKSMNHTEKDDVTLLCEPSDVNPASSVVITWGGLCRGQQGRTCTLDPPFAEHCGKEVTCTATNQKIPGKQVTARRTIELHRCKAQSSATAGNFWEGVGIGVGVSLVVVLLLVRGMLVVLWRRRLQLLPACQCCAPTYSSPSKKRQQEEQEQRTYTDLSLYEPVGEGSVPSAAGCAPTYSSPSKERQQEEQEQRTYTDLSLYEPVGEGSVPSAAGCAPTYSSPSKERQQEEQEQRTYTDLSLYEPVGEGSVPSAAGEV
ncbi:uncharacterized protein [Littorina saxatilis]|uniref:uncharacterized protein n=1 Tax=Littorina saxatilis TaxID=31220 RepID=UPI0038B5784A